MSFSYADAIKRQQREKRSYETVDSRTKNAIMSNEDRKLVLEPENAPKRSSGTGFAFHDILIKKAGNNSNEGISTQGYNRAQETNGSKSGPNSRMTWRNIVSKTQSAGSQISKQSSIQHANGRRGKRKDINGNSPGNQRKSSKPKPSLRSVSIGDLIAPEANQDNTVGSVERKASISKPSQPQPNSLVEFPALSLSNRKVPTPTLKWGAPQKRAAPKGPKRGDPATIDTKSKKALSKKDSTKRNSTPDATSSVAAMFAKPREYDDRARDGEEHQLLRLMEERTVYKKKGRQRVAPRKKKLTALKKKVLQERLKKWQELHPKQTASVVKVKSCRSGENPVFECFKSICLYGFAGDLEDDDEFEEVEQNLREMAAKIAEVDRILVPRGLDRSSMYPVFVRFNTLEGAVAAKACWEGLVIGGDVLSAVFVDESNFNKKIDWSNQVLIAEGNREFSKMPEASKTDNKTSTIVILGVLSEDDYEDSDCMKESLKFLKDAASKHAEISTVRPSDERNGNVVLVCSGGLTIAQVVVNGLSNTVIAGKALSACILETNDQTMESMSLSCIFLENILTQDDFDDQECLEETLSDVKELIEKHGKVVDIDAEGGKVKIYFVGSNPAARDAVDEMNSIVLGGAAVFARIEELSGRSIFLSNTLSEDDMDDDDCLEESLNDIREIVSKYGEVAGLKIVRDQNVVLVEFVPDTLRFTVDIVVSELNGSVIGGQIISASSCFRHDPTNAETLVADKAQPLAIETAMGSKEPLYSGDKLIPEFFAECKRVPKIPNGTELRDYAQVTNDERVRPLLTEMLGELMRLQKRAIEDKNAKARRRLVMGLREVCRGIRAHKVKMVVMANNLDEYGAIDEKLQEIIDLARAESIPLFFEFTKRSLGKALGKTIKVAVVGIQNADGAHQEFKKLVTIQQR